MTVAADHEDVATALLYEAGTAGIEVSLASGSDVVLLAYFADGTVLAPALTEALRALGARLEPVPVAEVDWVRHFREGLQPVTAGRFRIVPEWLAPPPVPPDAFVLVIDPGRAFGTGSHQSTRLCLAALEARAAAGDLGAVVDVGTGTGLLAVAALRLGARSATAIDLDPEAMDSARIHARLNSVELRLVRGDGGRPFRTGCFEVVLANLTAPLLRERAFELAALRRPEGILILAGLLTEDLPALRDVYGRFGPLVERMEDEWAGIEVGPSAGGAP